MRFYKIEPRFDRKTGQPQGTERVLAGFIDDFTGEIIDADSEDVPLYSVKFDYNSDAEEAWYYDEIDELLNLEGMRAEDSIDISHHIRHTLAEGEFHYLQDEHSTDTSMRLVRTWLENYNNDASPFRGCGNIGEATRIQRLQVVMRLLREKKFTPKELGLTED